MSCMNGYHHSNEVLKEYEVVVAAATGANTKIEQKSPHWAGVLKLKSFAETEAKAVNNKVLEFISLNVFFLW